MTDHYRSKTDPANVRACHCVGPKNGQPYCPCGMAARGLYVRNGRWIEPERDHGPVADAGNTTMDLRAPFDRRNHSTKTEDTPNG